MPIPELDPKTVLNTYTSSSVLPHLHMTMGSWDDYVNPLMSDLGPELMKLATDESREVDGISLMKKAFDCAFTTISFIYPVQCHPMIITKENISAKIEHPSYPGVKWVVEYRLPTLADGMAYVSLGIGRIHRIYPRSRIDKIIGVKRSYSISYEFRMPDRMVLRSPIREEMADLLQFIEQPYRTISEIRELPVDIGDVSSMLVTAYCKFFLYQRYYSLTETGIEGLELKNKLDAYSNAFEDVKQLTADLKQDAHKRYRNNSRFLKFTEY